MHGSTWSVVSPEPLELFPVLEQLPLFDFLKLTLLFAIFIALGTQLLWSALTRMFVHERLSRREQHSLFWRRLLFIGLMALPLYVLATVVTNLEIPTWQEPSSSP